MEALAQPDTEGEFVLDTDATGVAISGILHQWQGLPENRKLRPIVFGSKKLTSDTGQVWSPKTGNVRIVLLHIKKPQLPLPAQIQIERRQPSSFLVKNVLNGPSHHWSVDNGSCEVSFQH